ncbi:hypothetical protein ABPG74_009416 [Tetrahymena malaccensis]
MNQKAILAFLMTALVYAQSFEKELVYSCLQEEVDMSEIVPKDYLETFDEKYSNRKLQNLEPQPIRITLDFKELDNPRNGEGLTSNKKEYLKKIMYAAQVYLGKLIKVNPRQSPIKFLKSSGICYDVEVSEEIKTDGIDNSDLHIFVTFMNEKSDTLANAISCQFDPYPNVGRVKFNIGTMKIDEDNTQSFQDNFSTSLHEIIHILGFSGSNVQYWIDPDTGKPYGLSNVHKISKKENRWNIDNVLKIFSKNILRVSRNHYGCPSIDGMYLENQGKVGSFSSHWERDLLGNEFMTSSIVYRVYTISEFTAALLLDTGYFAEINSNLLMPIYWGKNKGCDFFNNSCNTQKNFHEFPDDSQDEACDFFSQGIGNLSKTDLYSQCKKIIPRNYKNCESDLFMADEYLRQNTGAGSRCFRSNANMKGYEFLDVKGRCFKATCANDLSSIQVNVWGDEYVTCSYPNQVISLSEQTTKTQGIMKCPPDFDLFCNFPKFCPNNCSNNGVCNNGYCICLKGYAGADCSQRCGEGQVWDGVRCAYNCSYGLFKNFDNTCKPTCPYKQFGDIQTGKCELCSVNCSTCFGSSFNQCLSCNNGYQLQGNQCVEFTCHSSCQSCSGPNANQCTSCTFGKYLDYKQTCQPCQQPCETCFKEASECTTCTQGYKMDTSSGKCVSENTCDSSCLECSDFRNPTKCTSCRIGFTLNNQGKCEKILCPFNQIMMNGKCVYCDRSCEGCLNDPKNCINCTVGYKFDLNYQSCIRICREGEFVDKYGNCQQCQSPCATCETFRDNCNSCVYGYTFNALLNSCELINGKCHESCNQCSKYNDSNSCTSCRDGMYLYSGKCFACNIGCKTCKNESYSCTSCESYEFLSRNKCIQCHSSCLTCSGIQTNCTSCKEGFLKDPNSGLCVLNTTKSCQFDEYLDSNYQCQKCKSPCSTCYQNANICTSCVSGYQHNSQTLKCEIEDPICDVGQYLDNNKKCKFCDYPCATCKDQSSKCTSCKNGFDLLRYTCEPQRCIEGYFINLLGKCVKCDDSCLKCATYSDKCTECADGFTQEANSQRCIKIPYDQQCHNTCQECTQPNNSSACTSCKDGFILENGKCILCSNPCQTCKRKSTYCTSCQQGYRLERAYGRCIQDCQQGSYFEQNENVCKPCSSPCENCEHYPYYCTSCKEGYKYNSELFTCDIDCKPGQYRDRYQQCKSCSEPCATCEYYDNRCLSCVSGYTYSNFSCQKDQRSNLRACHYTCNTCVKGMDPRSCDSCREGYTLIDGSCLKN